MIDPRAIAGISTRAKNGLEAYVKSSRGLNRPTSPFLFDWAEVRFKFPGMCAIRGVGKRTLRELVVIALVDAPLEGERLADELREMKWAALVCPHCGKKF